MENEGRGLAFFSCEKRGRETVFWLVTLSYSGPSESKKKEVKVQERKEIVKGEQRKGRRDFVLVYVGWQNKLATSDRKERRGNKRSWVVCLRVLSRGSKEGTKGHFFLCEGKDREEARERGSRTV